MYVHTDHPTCILYSILINDVSFSPVHEVNVTCNNIRLTRSASVYVLSITTETQCFVASAHGGHAQRSKRRIKISLINILFSEQACRGHWLPTNSPPALLPHTALYIILHNKILSYLCPVTLFCCAYRNC